MQRFREMIGRDEKMLIVFEWIRTAAKSDISVLILGPTGSGKEVVARMIHELSRRSVANFQAVNCAALPDTLFESEIFGYEKGAFTGAHDRKPGRLELANEGTLFLDEIGDMSLIAQAKLLRVLEERRFERLGGNKAISVDFRLISATNRPLEQFVRDGRFREDLYYRVNAFAIRLPSLRERQVDIPVLAQRFLARYCAAQGMPLDSKAFAREALDLLIAYPWPGNIRELESTVSRAALSAPGRIIRGTDIEFLHATPARAAAIGRPPAVAGARPSARTSAACSRPCSGTRRKPRGCSTSAAARCTARSRNTSSSREPRPAGRRTRDVDMAASRSSPVSSRPIGRPVSRSSSAVARRARLAPARPTTPRRRRELEPAGGDASATPTVTRAAARRRDDRSSAPRARRKAMR